MDPRLRDENYGLPRIPADLVEELRAGTLDKLRPTLWHMTDNGFVAGDLRDPGYRTVLGVELTPRAFHTYLEWDYAQGAKTYWISMMQAWVVHTVFVVTDDAENLYAFYYMQNSPKYLTCLGRVRPGPFASELQERLRGWCSELPLG